MDPRFRPIYNGHYTDGFYAEFMAALEGRVGTPIPYRVAETPFFVPDALRDRLARHARGIVDEVLSEASIAAGIKAIPAHLDTPGCDRAPHCLQVDLAITRDENGELDGKVVELQAFPSLYAMMVLKLDVLGELMHKRMPGLDRPWSIYFGGKDRAAFVEQFREAVLAGNDPENVVLLDLEPEKQKTLPDFAATRDLTGIEAVCPTKLTRRGDKLFYKRGATEVPIHRVYNRIVFDELEKVGAKLPFSYRDELELTWCSHPNWYWMVSKHSLPRLSHPAVPKARTLAELGTEIPEDLSRYVLKPLFSFAGGGVVVDVTRADVDGVSAEERPFWILQEKIDYLPGITMPDGQRSTGPEGVKAEVRMMFLRTDKQEKPELVLNLVRLSRGKMLGVDQNKNLTWVGGSIGLFDGPEAH